MDFAPVLELGVWNGSGVEQEAEGSRAARRIDTWGPRPDCRDCRGRGVHRTTYPWRTIPGDKNLSKVASLGADRALGLGVLPSQMKELCVDRIGNVRDRK